LKSNFESILKLIEVKPLVGDDLANCDANFPELTFLNLVFGYRSLDELKHVFPDCSTKDDETANMVDALFPRKISVIWPIS